ncbi:DUF3626 domain-containing protein [Burkholderia sp. SIMBA_043]|uniref:DUF3626 domain-containing protein n=1 Tax=Burkholderia TaxID=32008 RepID=UPI0005D9A65F|nr:DUF3626 domain-containing protein [Burkholderia vietnamiensis]AJY04576.1 hypothetical protein AK36_4260 [Burkholderia vietnamiensis LMG 10929]UBI24526.1 DUF3626 domain-containing protein [Burkholderia vietnamiensis]
MRGAVRCLLHGIADIAIQSVAPTLPDHRHGHCRRPYALPISDDRGQPTGVGPEFPVTPNFHPDTLLDGVSTLERIVREGVYRSQFETVTSNER